MTHSIFVSDLHLSPSRPAISRIFFAFLAGPAAQAEALYILGDLFDYWAGDDDLEAELNASVAGALRGLADRGAALHLMHGNRDFLLGAGFTRASGARLLSDPALIDLYGVPTLLMHGDTLCTDDVDYQAFRAKVRNPQYQTQFLAQSLAARKRIIAGLKDENAGEKQLKPEAIMDVASAAVEAALRSHGYPRLIHGHTHRPALHRHVVDAHACERWVLGDWYTAGSYLECSNAGCRVIELPAAD